MPVTPGHSYRMGVDFHHNLLQWQIVLTVTAAPTVSHTKGMIFIPKEMHYCIEVSKSQKFKNPMQLENNTINASVKSKTNNCFSLSGFCSASKTLCRISWQPGNAKVSLVISLTIFINT